MGRFDALTQLKKPPIAPPVVEKARKTASPQDGKPESPQTVSPANPKDHLPANPHVDQSAIPQKRLPVQEVVEKYTTRLEPSLIKEIKVYAAQHDLADYEVVKQAVNEYFAKRK